MTDSSPSNVKVNTAMNSKGLRRDANPSYHVKKVNTALNSKGLRLSQGHFLVLGLSKYRPEFKGIKTGLNRACFYAVLSKYRPEFKGIKTDFLARLRHQGASKYRPEFKGIKTHFVLAIRPAQISKYRPEFKGIKTLGLLEVFNLVKKVNTALNSKGLRP